MGQALASDVMFVNEISSYIKTMVKWKSSLPHLVLKTRLLLQHFSLAAIWLKPHVKMVYRCKMFQANERFQEEGDSANNGTEPTAVEEQAQSEAAENDYGRSGMGEEEMKELKEKCNKRPNELIEVPEGLQYEDSVSTFSTLSAWARLGLGLEIALLCGICLNTTILSVLLHHTRHHLSTVTILFIFNILFSNVLFVASFLCLYSDIVLDTKYTNPSSNSSQEVEEDPGVGSTEDEDPTTPQLFIAEILQIHLYKPSEFLKNLLQETLLSLAQNGSLLGLTNLLVLVLVVINRSMSGKGIRLSRGKVIAVFGGVWLFLVVSHVLFSALQYFAISQLHELLELTSNPSQFACRRSASFMVYKEIGERCDRLGVYQDLGHFLLRGHTLFTVVLLSISLVIFVVTVYCHRRVQKQHHFLNANATNRKNSGGGEGGAESSAGSGLRRRRDSSPFRRRETLFQTLVLSFFIEMYVMVVNDRREVAWWASVYQLTRIAAFIDPLFNPVLVAVRTPIIRRRLRLCTYSVLRFLCAVFCPWCRRTSLSLQRRKRHQDSIAITMKTWTERKRSSGSRGASSASYLSSNESRKAFNWKKLIRSILAKFECFLQNVHHIFFEMNGSNLEAVSEIELMPKIRDVSKAEQLELAIRKMNFCYCPTNSHGDPFVQSSSTQTFDDGTQWQGIGEEAFSTGENGRTDSDGMATENHSVAWKHSKLIYDLFLAVLGSNEFRVTEAKSFVDPPFVRRLITNFATSPESEERQCLARILRRIYVKFLRLRLHIRKHLLYSLLEVVFDERSQLATTKTFFGIAEILEVLENVINGLKVPLKCDDRQMLLKVLLPLHRISSLEHFYKALIDRVLQFIALDPSLTPATIDALLKWWPKTSGQREIIFLEELELILGKAEDQRILRELIGKLFVQLAKCISSQHFQVSIKALHFWKNERILQLSKQNSAQIIQIIFDPLGEVAKTHWSAKIRSEAKYLQNVMMEMNWKVYSKGMAAESSKNARQCIFRYLPTSQRLSESENKLKKI
uniref:G-protein coupled receptors family 1 profile domain-containing protein n=1 Tax=Globodera rostochiensis TaxID=31243 RepID=A0A914H2C7_GLORO